MPRYTIHFEGRVQGVGFRYTARNLAAGYALAGYVQNLPDGRVRLVAEGSTADLDAFLSELQRGMHGYIRRTDLDRSEATGEFGEPTAGHLAIRH